MRHIVHTCLLGLRLISSVDNVNAKDARISFFENAFTDSNYQWFFVKSGIEKRRLANAAKFVLPDTSAGS